MLDSALLSVQGLAHAEPQDWNASSPHKMKSHPFFKAHLSPVSSEKLSRAPSAL